LRHSRSTTPHRQSDPPPYQQNSDTVHERSRNIPPDCLSNHAGRHRRMQQPNSHKHLHYHHKQWHSRLLHVRRQLDIRHRLNIARRREQPVVEQLLKKPTWILLLVSLSLLTIAYVSTILPQVVPQIIVGGNVVLPQCNTVSYSAIVPVGSGTIKLGCTSGPAFISNGGTSKVYYRGNTTNLYC